MITSVTFEESGHGSLNVYIKNDHILIDVDGTIEAKLGIEDILKLKDILQNCIKVIET